MCFLFFGFCSPIWSELQWKTLESTRKFDNVLFSISFTSTHTWIFRRMRECAWNTHLICNNTYRVKEREREREAWDTLYFYTYCIASHLVFITMFSAISDDYFFSSLFQLLPTIFILNLFYSFQTTNNKHTHTYEYMRIVHAYATAHKSSRILWIEITRKKRMKKKKKKNSLNERETNESR